MKKIKVIYLLGCARSGSTVLGIILGNIKGLFYPGELFAWNKYKGVPHNQKKETREFWEKVLKNSRELKPFFKYDFFDLMESYYSFRNFLKWGDQKLWKDYCDSNTALFRRLAQISRAHAIVDSSHYALRAFWLSKEPRIDLNLIYLVREPVSVMNAFLKQDIEQRSKNPVTGNIYYGMVNFLCTMVYLFFTKGKKIKVRYEDMINEPEVTISRITRELGIKQRIHGFNDMEVGHLFEANRIKNEFKIDLERKNKDIKINPLWRFVIKLIQLPFYLIFGYQIMK